MVDSTRESITTQTESSSHVKQKPISMQNVMVMLWQTSHESQLRLKLCRQAM